MALACSLQDTKEMLRLLVGVWKGTLGDQMAGTLSRLWSFFDSWLLARSFHRLLLAGAQNQPSFPLCGLLSVWAISKFTRHPFQKAFRVTLLLWNT